MAEKYLQLIEDKKRRKLEASLLISEMNTLTAAAFSLGDIRFVMAMEQRDVSEDELIRLNQIYEKAKSWTPLNPQMLQGLK